jgi:hypothetical protein
MGPKGQEASPKGETNAEASNLVAQFSCRGYRRSGAFAASVGRASRSADRSNNASEEARCKDAPSEAEGIRNSPGDLWRRAKLIGAVCVAVSEPVPALPIDVAGRRPELPRIATRRNF